MGIAECLEVDTETLKGLILVMEGFALTVPALASPDFLPEFPDLPGSAVNLFLGNLSPDLPSFSADIPGIGKISFEGVDLNAGLDVPVFDPAALVDFILGMIDIVAGMPKLFIELEQGLPVVKVPELPDAVIELVGASLGLPSAPVLTVEFKEKLLACVVDVVLDGIK